MTPSKHNFTETQVRVSNIKPDTIKSFKRFLVVGAGWAGRTIAHEIESHGAGQVIGFLDDKPHSAETISEIKAELIGRTDQLAELAKLHQIDCVVIAVTHDRADHLIRQMIRCYEMSMPVVEMPDLYAQLTGKIPVKHLTHHWLIPNLTKPVNNLYWLFHESTNLFISFLIFVFGFLPLLPIVSLMIKLDSKGGIFYRQTRVGLNGEQFQLLKFRTMSKGADQTGEKWTLKNDSRITRVGKWLRKFRIDELPQLLNVFRGEMSLIGPRPEAVELVEEFTKEIPFYQYRYLVKPGITGWAQVNYENTCSVDGALEKLQYDLYWIKKRSVWLDMKIIFKSAMVMLTGFGA